MTAAEIEVAAPLQQDGHAHQETKGNPMPTQTTKPGALAALMETARDCGYRINIGASDVLALSVDLVGLDRAIPVAEDHHTWLLDGAIYAHSTTTSKGIPTVAAWTSQGSSLVVDDFIAAVHEYFFSLALELVPA